MNSHGVAGVNHPISRTSDACADDASDRERSCVRESVVLRHSRTSDAILSCDRATNTAGSAILR